MYRFSCFSVSHIRQSRQLVIRLILFMVYFDLSQWVFSPLWRQHLGVFVGLVPLFKTEPLSDIGQTGGKKRVVIPSWPGFAFVVFFVFGFWFCLCLFGFGLVLLLFCIFAHEALEYSLDYVQGRNRLLLRLVSCDEHTCYYQFIFRQVQTCGTTWRKPCWRWTACTDIHALWIQCSARHPWSVAFRQARSSLRGGRRCCIRHLKLKQDALLSYSGCWAMNEEKNY